MAAARSPRRHPLAAGEETGPTAALEALTEARARTLALVAGLSDADVETAHSELMSPLVWDLAHIAAYEDLWLVHRYAGEPLLEPELAAMYDAFETPRAVRGTLPLLDRAQAHDYLDEVRDRVHTVLQRRGAGNGDLVELVLRHEQQHGETMLQAIALHRLLPAPRVPRTARPSPSPRLHGPRARRGARRPVPARRPPLRFRLRQRAAAPPGPRSRRSASARPRSPTPPG